MCMSVGLAYLTSSSDMGRPSWLGVYLSSFGIAAIATAWATRPIARSALGAALLAYAITGIGMGVGIGLFCVALPMLSWVLPASANLPIDLDSAAGAAAFVGCLFGSIAAVAAFFGSMLRRP
jgi:hypothetical protein